MLRKASTTERREPSELNFRKHWQLTWLRNFDAQWNKLRKWEVLTEVALTSTDRSQLQY